MSTTTTKAIFYGSQLGGKTKIDYSYTDNPWKLVLKDIFNMIRATWALPFILFPIGPLASGDMDELAPTLDNMFCVVLHTILVSTQIGFLFVFPMSLLFPLWMSGIAIVSFVGVNQLVCYILNGASSTYTSDSGLVPLRLEHAGEQWIYLNGVATGEHWMRSNLNRLALTFKRPILGIHNPTSGIIFDVFECVLQRCFNYATTDVRMFHKILKEKLFDPQLTRVIVICHSQGATQGGLAIDWLLQEIPQDLLVKLELYTFGSAANHCNNPHLNVASHHNILSKPRHSHADVIYPLSNRQAVQSSTTVSVFRITVELEEEPQPSQPDNISPEGTQRVWTGSPGGTEGRVMGHIEHYAHSTDFVAIWGIIHYATSVPATRELPQFVGRLFIRESRLGGHQFCQHYLDGMFPLARDPETGRFLGADENNEFMETPVQAGEGDLGWENAQAALRICREQGSDEWTSSCERPCLARPGEVQMGDDVVRIKHLSRLWMYRNGMQPPLTPIQAKLQRRGTSTTV